MKLRRHLNRTMLSALLVIGVGANAAFAISPLQERPRKAKQTAPEKPQATDAPNAEKLPSADEILERHIEAVGGAKALKKIEYRTITGTFEFVGAGMKGTFTMRQAAPHFLLQEMSAPESGFEAKTGYNGEVGWTVNSIKGPQLLEGDMLHAIKHDAYPQAELEYKERFTTRETIGKEEFNGTMCYKLKLVTTDGIATESFYDLDTGLLVGVKGELETPQGRMKTVTLVDDYKEVDGVKYPHKTTTMLPDHHLTEARATNEISHEEFSKDVFALPKAIQTLVDVQAKENEGRSGGAGDGAAGEDGE